MKRSLLVVVSALAPSVSACGGGDAEAPGPTAPGTNVPSSVQIVSGDGQSANAGGALAAPITVKVLGTRGSGVAGVAVSWAVTAGGGTTSVASNATDANGEASATWTVGATAGENVVTATVSGLSPVTFRATGTVGPAVRFEKSAGDAQTGAAGEALKDSVGVRITDAHGNPVSGATVVWTVTAGGGSTGPASSTTNTSGIARASWTLGTKAGEAQALSATSGSLTALGFGATATAGAVATVALTPPSLSIKVGEESQLAATLKDRFDNIITGRTPTWSSSASGIATVEASGKVTGVAPGSATISVSAEGKSASTAATVLAPSAPVIASISASPLLPGATVTLTGSGFSPDPAANTVTVAGIAATVAAATSTQLTIGIPARSAFECAPTRNVPVSVTVGSLNGSRDHPLRVANQVSLAAGQAVVLTDPVQAHCSEIPSSGGRYHVAVFNTSPSADAVSAFRLKGSTEGSTVPAARMVADQAAYASVQTVEQMERQRRARAHGEMLDRSMKLMERLGTPKFRFQTSASISARAPLSVGAVVAVRVPESCTTYSTINARVVYSGAKGAVLEDADAPLAGTMDAYYTALGKEYDASMAPVLEQYFGNPLALDASLDNNGQVMMVFTPVVNQSPSTLGFVWSGDMYPRTDCEQSNVGEIFYARVPTNTASGFDTDTKDQWFHDMRAAVIHEVKHITSNVERMSRGSEIEDRWLEESTAMISEEIWARSFYGFAQRGNTGFNASVHCALNPELASCGGKPNAMLDNFNFLYEYYGSASQRTPIGSASDTDYSFYGSGWSLVRWAADHYSTSEAAFFRALTQEPQLRGLENLQARSGKSFEEMLGLWSLSLAAEFASTPSMQATVTHPSWDVKDIFAGLNTYNSDVFPQVQPLAGAAVAYGSFDVGVPEVRGGSAAHFTLSGSQASAQLLQVVSAAGGAAPTNLRMAIVRFE